jgi:transcription elongation factor GreA
MAEYTMTQAGLEKLKEELRKLKQEKRPAVIARIKEARELGDLSENADYQDAREEQAFIEGRIQELEAMIKDANVVEDKHSGAVEVGSVVEATLDGENITFTVVGPNESDPGTGAISNESPIGRALMGHIAGDVVGVNTPDGVVEYKIISVK